MVSSRAGLRLLLGFAILPPAAALVMFATCLVLWGVGAWALEGTPSFDVAVSQGIAVGILAASATVLGAVPAVAWLIHRGELSFRNVVLLGVIVGNAPFAIIVISILATQFVRGTLSFDVGQLWFGWYGLVRAIVLGVCFGTTLAMLWWVVAVRGSELERPARQS